MFILLSDIIHNCFRSALQRFVEKGTGRFLFLVLGCKRLYPPINMKDSLITIAGFAFGSLTQKGSYFSAVVKS
jgi:hypothetical protein